MPEAGVHVAVLAKAYAVTRISLAAVVVMLGAECDRLLAVFTPFWTSTGVVVLTPLNDRMPPAEPLDELNVQLYVAGSLLPATFQYVASDEELPETLLRRRTSVQPAGAVIVAVDGRTAMTAIITLPATVLAG